MFSKQINSFTPGRCEGNFTSLFFKLILRIGILSTSWEIGLSLVAQSSIDATSASVWVMAWSRQVDPELCRHMATRSQRVENSHIL